jgi:hypothetical protein
MSSKKLQKSSISNLKKFKMSIFVPRWEILFVPKITLQQKTFNFYQQSRLEACTKVQPQGSGSIGFILPVEDTINGGDHAQYSENTSQTNKSPQPNSFWKAHLGPIIFHEHQTGHDDSEITVTDRSTKMQNIGNINISSAYDKQHLNCTES